MHHVTCVKTREPKNLSPVTTVRYAMAAPLPPAAGSTSTNTALAGGAWAPVTVLPPPGPDQAGPARPTVGDGPDRAAPVQLRPPTPSPGQARLGVGGRASVYVRRGTKI